LNGERYKVVTKETSALVKGEYGKTPAEVGKILKDLVLNGDEPITCRPADLIDKDEYKNMKDQFQEIIKSENLEIENDDENLLIYTLFPEIGLLFLKNKNNNDFFEKSPSQLNEDKEGFYKVKIDEKEYIVKFSKTAEPEIIDGINVNSIKTKAVDVNENQVGTLVNAPLGGNIFSIEKNVGENVHEDDTVIVLEAMKMETTVKTPIGGKILKVYVQNGDKVKSGDPLFEVST
jgi:oxaloacetate decarboxylase alpha subunit